MSACRQLRKMSAAEMSEARQFVLLYPAVGRGNGKFLFHVKQIVFLYQGRQKFLFHVKQKSFERRPSFERGLSFECASRSNGRRGSKCALRGVVKRAARLSSLAIVIASICFIADDGKVTFGGFEWIGLPRKSRGGHFNLRFQLTGRRCARKAEMPRSVFIAHGLSIRFPNDLEVHPCGSGYRVQRRPSRLIHDCDVAHLHCAGIAIRAESRSAIGNRNNPVKS